MNVHDDAWIDDAFAAALANAKRLADEEPPVDEQDTPVLPAAAVEKARRERSRRRRVQAPDYVLPADQYDALITRMRRAEGAQSELRTVLHLMLLALDEGKQLSALLISRARKLLEK